jgi:hypothetical protein
MSVEDSGRIYIAEFRRKCELLKEPDGSLQQDIALPIFVNEYLNPSFYLEYPEEWKRAFEILLKHIDSPIGGSIKKKTCINLLKESDLYDRTIDLLRSLEKDSDRCVRIQAGEVLIREDRIQSVCEE